MVVYLSQIFLFAGIFLVCLNFFLWFFTAHELRKVIKRRLRYEINPTDRKSIFLRFFDLFAPLNYFVVRRFVKRENLENKLFGARVGMTPEQFFGAKEFMALVALFLGIGFLPAGEVLKVAVAAVAGFFLPDLWLDMKLKARRAAVVRTLPDTVDLLSLCVDAGLDFIAAARWIVEKSKTSAFIEELSLMLHEIKVGKPRREALKDLSRRISAPDVTAFARTLIQADRMGTPIAEALAILSEDVRERFFRRAERAALQSPMKMLIPLIFFILPVVGVIVGGPIAIQFMSGNLLGGMGAGVK
ncbi:MAG: type II secretion system F family protein [Candidatus Omnitrophica bacterium]|nr:type II secretion system F family protein [Candidatus Omnitrophota bacterium]MDD5574448.1 type II secretion system F family protein [Candidatus Omnitrophota bacterium]